MPLDLASDPLMGQLANNLPLKKWHLSLVRPITMAIQLPVDPLACSLFSA